MGRKRTHILTLTLHLGPYINYRVNITTHKLHMNMRFLPLTAAVCIGTLNALHSKQPCWSEGYLKPKPGTYCYLPDVCHLCVLWSLSLSLQSVPRCNKKVALYVYEEEMIFSCSKERTARLNKQCRLLGRKIWVCVSFSRSLCRYSPFHAVKKLHCMFEKKKKS